MRLPSNFRREQICHAFSSTKSLRGMRIPLLSSSYRAINSRQWICGTCRQHRARLYSTPHPSNLRNGSLKIDQNSPASSNSQLLDNAQAIEKNSQSIPNQGLQKTHSNYNEPYFVTTPIFYVNGGNIKFLVKLKP